MESSVHLVFVSWTALLIHLTYGEGKEQTWLNFVPVYLTVVDPQFSKQSVYKIASI